MRKNLLEAIYLGDYLPAEKVSGGEEYEEYHEAAAEAAAVYEQFKERLDPERVEELDKVLEANGVATAATTKDNFVEGARFGARLILELLGDELVN